MKLIYIAGAYRGTDDTPWSREMNMQRAERAGRKLMTRGDYFAVVPHKMCHNWDGSSLPNGQILRGMLALLTCCDAIAVLPSYEESRGTILEMATARRVGIRILMPLLRCGTWEWVDDELDLQMRIPTGR